jgi:hypothetical protein
MSLGHGASIVTNGLVLCLDAANTKSYPGSGTTWSDLSGFNNTGTLVNGATYSSANNGSIAFDGTSGYINCGSAPVIGSSLTGLTVEVWLYSTARTTKCIAENGSAHNANTFYMFQENVVNFSFEVWGGTTYDALYSNFTYQLNTWYHLVGTWSSGNRVKMYSNGVESGAAPFGSVQTAVANGNTNLMIGARAGTGSWWSGNIPTARFYNRALSAYEVRQNFNAARSRYGL